MTHFNILLIEDDPTWLSSLQKMFNLLNLVQIRSATTLAQARQLMEDQLPDLVIADIVLPDGLSFELFISHYKQLPVIFQTSHRNEHFLSKAIRMPNVGFLVKPFESFNLQAAIEVVISRMSDQLPNYPSNAPTGLSVVGKHRQPMTIPFKEIFWIKGEGNYSIICTHERKYALKRSLRKLMEELPATFVQVQKAYIVNQNCIEHIKVSTLQIKEHLIPIGRTYRKQLLNNIAMQ